MSVVIAKWSIAEYHRLRDIGVLDERRVELLKGDIVEMAIEGEPHAYSTDEAGEYLLRLLDDRAKVRQAHPITLPNDSEPEPDLAIVQRLGREYRSHHPYPENIYWLIEYADSSLSKDLETKSQVYAEVGIPEYWVINLREMQLVVFRNPSQEGYQTQTIVTSGEIQPLAFPDISISVAKLLSV